MFVRFASAAVAMAASLAVATTACAAPFSMWGENEKATVALKYSSAETNTAEGAKALALRIRVAAAQVCGGDDPVVRSGSHFQACRGAAIDRALGVLNAPLVANALGRAPTSFATAAAHR